ncbi:type II secretion system F family protein [Neomoorella mulderi]|uniref:Bacterial type II secretion system protein F domain protein n=1 Tax=Moorella mulderi DSM 14980 TaxID=1122241 RepID=A0A151AT21_9FIRM|nr:type II secretion system F family protein [Moorella mulderi]KYH30755.1 bacterial type II secretion system protein F domain protein [Moorella mulderi DSM 14980]
MTDVKLVSFLIFIFLGSLVFYLGRGRFTGFLEGYRRRQLLAPPARGSAWYLLARMGRSKEGFVLTTIFLAVLGMAAGILLDNPAASILLAVFAVIYSYKKLEVDYRQHKARMDEQAQAALQMIASLYDTTGDLVRAIEGAAGCIPAPMRDELVRTLVEYRLGGSLGNALESFAERADNRDIDIFVKAVTLSEKYGTNTAEVVAEIARVIRDRITLREELKSEVRGQGLTINLFLLFLPLTAIALLYFSNEARHVITATFFGKAVICFIILVEFLAWYFTRGLGVVEEL